MNRLEIALRTTVRKIGLAGPLVRMLESGAARRRVALREDYAAARPDNANVSVLGRSATLKVTNAEEYAHYLAEPESRIMGVVFDNIKPGDSVWDVGANIGLYTLLIGAAVGPTGTVLAFEPMPPCLERLRENIALNNAPHVRAMGMALGDKRERLYMVVGSGGLEGDIRVVREAPPGAPVVDVIPGDDLRREQGLAVPNLIKIDVQGLEEAVLKGLDVTLRDPACRVVICEIHYAILASRGDADAPLRIERRLRECGFTRIKRLDRNHIGAWKG